MALSSSWLRPSTVEVRPEKVLDWASMDPEKLSVMAWRMIL